MGSIDAEIGHLTGTLAAKALNVEQVDSGAKKRAGPARQVT